MTEHIVFLLFLAEVEYSVWVSFFTLVYIFNSTDSGLNWLNNVLIESSMLKVAIKEPSASR